MNTDELKKLLDALQIARREILMGLRGTIEGDGLRYLDDAILYVLVRTDVHEPEERP